MNTSTTQDFRYLDRPQGRVAYSLDGAGPLIVAIPGMGDLRSSYRELVAPLIDAGYRVAVMDLRGHGDSDTTFSAHGDIATGQDLIALVEKLDGPAVVLGNSMGAAAAAWAAAERPDLFAGLVLYGPLLREGSSSRLVMTTNRLLYRIVLARPWGARFWAGYYRSINKGTRAPWLDEHIAEITATLRKPGRLRSFRDLALQLDHSVVEPRLIDVKAPIRAFVGELDPDYSDPRAESEWMANLGAQVDLVSDSGHYPHAQRPDITVPATLEFLAALRDESVVGWATRA
ncbi:alpha/beta hydrolase [Glaciihabitans sp. UYNi722]|uniref:alpha/beta fold hydrolase n=1 Tax=Glaciihabitans sp. UYNi722 TaxID=3156344 RepID=UPI003394B5B4